MPKELDELGLKQAELVIVLQKEEGVCGSFYRLDRPDLKECRSAALTFCSS